MTDCRRRSYSPRFQMPETRVRRSIVEVLAAEPDRKRGRLVFQAHPRHLNVLSGGSPDLPGVTGEEGHADSGQMLVENIPAVWRVAEVLDGQARCEVGNGYVPAGHLSERSNQWSA